MSEYSQISDITLSLQPILGAITTLGFESLLIYDRVTHTFILEQYLSKSITEVVQEKGLIAIMEENNVFRTIEINRTNFWELSPNPQTCMLSINFCADRQRELYLNFQASPIHTNEQEIRYLMCSLKFSSKRELNISFIDRDSQCIWHYNIYNKRFIKDNMGVLSRMEIEVIRLSKAGYTQQDMARILNKSADTIKYYKKSLYTKLDIHTMAECIAFCEMHHII